MLTSDLHGLNIIMNSVDKLLEYARVNGYSIEDEKNDNIDHVGIVKQVKVPIAKMNKRSMKLLG